MKSNIIEPLRNYFLSIIFPSRIDINEKSGEIIKGATFFFFFNCFILLIFSIFIPEQKKSIAQIQNLNFNVKLFDQLSVVSIIFFIIYWLVGLFVFTLLRHVLLRITGFQSKFIHQLAGSSPGFSCFIFVALIVRIVNHLSPGMIDPGLSNDLMIRIAIMAGLYLTAVFLEARSYLGLMKKLNGFRFPLFVLNWVLPYMSMMFLIMFVIISAIFLK